jgi:hypothetical protein
MNKQLYTLVFLVFALGCIKPIEIDSIIEHEPTLIIDALLTNELKHHVVKLSKSIPLDSTELVKESNAQIKIIDNNNIVYNFSEGEKGVYVSDDIFKAEKDKKYSLEVITSDGTNYTSNQEEIYGFNTIDEVEIKKENNKFNEEVLSIYVKSDGSNNENAQYYRYRIEETYKIIAPNWRVLMFDRTKLPEIVTVPNTEFYKICYGSDETKEIVMKETTLLNEKSIEFSIYHLKEDNFKIAHRYSALVKQYVQSPEAHAYSTKVLRNSTSQSLLAQSQPGALIGNINSDKKVYGYFEVSSVSEKRMFFNHSDFFEYSERSFSYPEVCGTPYYPALRVRSRYGGYNYPLREAITSGDWLYAKEDEIVSGTYHIVKRGCGDCNTYGSNIKPSFWID